MVETPRLQAKNRVAMSTESTSQRCAALSGLWLEKRSFPGLAPWAFLSRCFAAQFSASPLRGSRGQAPKGRNRRAQGVSPGNSRPPRKSPERAEQVGRSKSPSGDTGRTPRLPGEGCSDSAPKIGPVRAATVRERVWGSNYSRSLTLAALNPEVIVQFSCAWVPRHEVLSRNSVGDHLEPRRGGRE